MIVQHSQRSLALVAFALASAVGSAARADTGVQLGARTGVQLLDDGRKRLRTQRSSRTAMRCDAMRLLGERADPRGQRRPVSQAAG
jgi:hypothetical protein